MSLASTFWWARLRRFARRGRGVVVMGRLWIHGSGAVEVGDATRFDGGGLGIELHPGKNARIVIGSRCCLNEGVSIEACELVQLGDGVTIGPWVKILDNHFHPLHGNRLERPPSEPVIIEDDVAIGARAIILPGVRIARGARVAEGAVVSRRVRAGAVVSGNPARQVATA